jgi:hypothetical protein
MSDFEAGFEVDEETTVFYRKEITINDLPAMLEEWVWCEIYAKSCIFMTRDTKTMTNESLVRMFESHMKIKGLDAYTISRGDIYTFLNYDFLYHDPD